MLSMRSSSRTPIKLSMYNSKISPTSSESTKSLTNSTSSSANSSGADCFSVDSNCLDKSISEIICWRVSGCKSAVPVEITGEVTRKEKVRKLKIMANRMPKMLKIILHAFIEFSFVIID